MLFVSDEGHGRKYSNMSLIWDTIRSQVDQMLEQSPTMTDNNYQMHEKRIAQRWKGAKAPANVFDVRCKFLELPPGNRWMLHFSGCIFTLQLEQLHHIAKKRGHDSVKLNMQNRTERSGSKWSCGSLMEVCCCTAMHLGPERSPGSSKLAELCRIPLNDVRTARSSST